MKHILDGITVLDFTQFIAGPVMTRAMAEMGAEVIKVELAPRGDFARQMPVMKDGRSAYYVQQNQAKRGLCLDLKDPRALELVRGLVTKADVLVENFSPGTIGRLGLGWEAVHAINPRLIMCSISAFGQEGPLADQPGFDYIAQAYTGVTHLIGEPGEAPPVTGVAIGDVGAGISALAAVNGALYHRLASGGEGQYLDIALIDFYFYSHSLSVEVWSASGGAIQPNRSGCHHQHVAPVGVFKGSEGFLFICAVSDDMWQRLVRAMGRDDLADDPRFGGLVQRRENLEPLAEIIEGWIQAQTSDQVALEKMQAERVPVAPVLDVAQAIQTPHLQQRGTVRTVTDPIVGSYQIPGVPLRFSAFPEPAAEGAPFLGEHNRDVLTRHLSMPAAEIDALEAAGVLVSEPMPKADAAD